MAYSLNRNYQDEINKAVSGGDYALASRLEKERNEKIDGESLSYEKTYNYQKPEGITDATYNAMNKQYTASDKQQQLDANKQNAGNKVTNLTNKSNIVSSSTWADIESEFKTPTAVKQADAYLADQLQKIQSGRTSYTEQLREAMDKILNREKFSYDVDTDPLFQQALASAMGSGKQAMQDTIGQASALTGGYGSSYATSAGNQAYNAFIEDAYDNLPQYYQMAREAYEAEGDELYRQYSMFSTEDEKEYNRNITAFDATSQYRNQLYNEAYGQYRDSKSDAFATANLEISEHGQLVSDAVNAYNIAADLADTEHERDYQSWLDSINIAMQKGQIERGAYEYEQNYAQTEKWNQAEMDYKNAALAEDQRQANMSNALGWANHNLSREQFEYSKTASNEEIPELTDDDIEAIAQIAKNGGTTADAKNMLALKGIVLEGGQEQALESVFNSAKTEKKNEKIAPTNTGIATGFTTGKGNNFEIRINGEDYDVQTKGKVSEKAKKVLDKYELSNNMAIAHNGRVFVKYKDNYYEVESQWMDEDQFADVIDLLSKKSK